VNFFIGVTDYDWFRLHAAKQTVEEVNFWRPSPGMPFKVLQPGEALLFKLHSPRNFIAGGGFFTKFLQLPITLAWEAFGEGNGVRSFAGMRQRIGKYRRAEIGPTENPNIGCILLAEPFFFQEHDWIPCPPDFSMNIVSGKSYDVASETGKAVWNAVAERLQLYAAATDQPGPAMIAAAESARFGAPILVQPRLGQGSFRVLVTDAYHRRCAMTLERTLPVLEAAHIRPYSDGGKHELSNGLLLRSDLHTLFDNGYITVDPADRRIVVSARIREEFDNGKEYYQLHGKPLHVPLEPKLIPSVANLEYHAYSVFR
jgi:putative restriction endonuclease